MRIWLLAVCLLLMIGTGGDSQWLIDYIGQDASIYDQISSSSIVIVGLVFPFKFMIRLKL